MSTQRHTSIIQRKIRKNKSQSKYYVFTTTNIRAMFVIHDVIKVFNSYVDIPAIIVTSDNDLNKRLPGRSLLVKAKGSNAIRIVTKQVKHRISSL